MGLVQNNVDLAQGWFLGCGYFPGAFTHNNTQLLGRPELPDKTALRNNHTHGCVKWP